MQKLGHMPNFHYSIYLVSLNGMDGQKKNRHGMKILPFQVPSQPECTIDRDSRRGAILGMILVLLLR